jgi:hypothetical protein
VKIWQGVASEQPDELVLCKTALQLAHGVEGKARSMTLLEIADPDRRAPGKASSCGKSRFKRRHVLGALLQRIARGHEPPQLVQLQSLHGVEADTAVSPMSRVEGPPK